MRKNLINFLILSLFVSGCASTRETTKFDGKWEFYKMHPFDEEPKACLPKEDVIKLRKLLIQGQLREEQR